MRRLLLQGLFCMAAPSTLLAQTRAPEREAAATITAADVARRIGIIADDSMMGRDTPSEGLELTAQYVAEQFRRFGLKPGGDSGSWFQQYSVSERRLDPAGSRVVFTAEGRTEVADFTAAARYDKGPIREKAISGRALLVGGAQTAESAEQLTLENRVVLYLPPEPAPPAIVQQVTRVLYLSGPKALVILSTADSASFLATIPNRAPRRTVIGAESPQPLVVQVRAGAVPSTLTAAGVDLIAVSGSSTPIVRELSDLRIDLELRDTVMSSFTAPNTVGILEGSDRTLRKEYLVYSAHMDHIGVTRGRADSINNGADDDASGTAGVIELAEAFSRRRARPKRSIIFLTVSGEEKGLWGSNVFTSSPPVPVDRMVANINMDMIGRNWPDTIVAIGKDHSDLGVTLDRVNAAHPELGITAIDDLWPEERFYFRSDHYNFARRGVPILFFFNGVHEDYHQVTDSPDKINSEKEARILRLLFYLGQEIANAARRPEWKSESYEEIVEQ